MEMDWPSTDWRETCLWLRLCIIYTSCSLQLSWVSHSLDQMASNVGRQSMKPDRKPVTESKEWLFFITDFQQNDCGDMSIRILFSSIAASQSLSCLETMPTLPMTHKGHNNNCATNNVQHHTEHASVYGPSNLQAVFTLKGLFLLISRGI